MFGMGTGGTSQLSPLNLLDIGLWILDVGHPTPLPLSLLGEYLHKSIFPENFTEDILAF